MPGILDGKVALVTGASSGIGEATALALAEKGARVAAAARSSDRLQAVVKHIEERGGQAMPLVVDIADETQVREMVRRVRETWGRVDILVNDAGVAHLGPIDGAKIEDWRQMVNINLLGLMYAAREVLPLMKAQGSGHIVNVSSVAGRTVREGMGVYSATKWGVNAFSEALRQEVAKQHIRVTVIEPGVVATPIQEHLVDTGGPVQVPAWMRDLTPLQSEDIAASIVFAVTQPAQVDVSELLIRPADQTL